MLHLQSNSTKKIDKIRTKSVRTPWQENKTDQKNNLSNLITHNVFQDKSAPVKNKNKTHLKLIMFATLMIHTCNLTITSKCNEFDVA